MEPATINLANLKNDYEKMVLERRLAAVRAAMAHDILATSEAFRALGTAEGALAVVNEMINNNVTHCVH